MTKDAILAAKSMLIAIETYNKLRKTLPTMLIELRGDVSQVIIAKRAGVSQPIISYLETGQFEKMTTDRIARIIRAYLSLYE